MANKMTKKEMFAIIRTADFSNCSVDVDTILDFIDHEVDLLNRKSSAGGDRKMTPTQIENVGFKENILNFMERGKHYSITELIKFVPEISHLTNQRVSAIVRQLVTDGLVERCVDKRKTTFVKIAD